MPLVWQDPEVALIHRGVPIYHTYKDNNIFGKAVYWYSFSTRPGQGEFDVRTLPPGRVSEGRTHALTIRAAIENGDLKVPEEYQPACPHENLCVDSYKVTCADAHVLLARTEDTGQVSDIEFNRIDGEIGDVQFYCEDCRESFKWEEVLGF